MLFKYSGIDANGLKIKSKIEASNLNEAKSKLKVKGIIYTTIKEDELFFLNFNFKRRKELDLNTLSKISRDLSIYINSGITLIESINLLKQRYKNNKVLFSFFDNLKIFLDEGKTLYDA